MRWAGSLIICVWIILAVCEERCLHAQESPNPDSAVPVHEQAAETTTSTPSPTTSEPDLEARVRQLEELWEQQQAQLAKPASGELQLPSVRWVGAVQTDFVWFDQSAANRDAVGNAQDGAGIRRARVGAIGDIYETIAYRLEMDFALAGHPTFMDNWVSISDLPVLGMLKAGLYFEPFGLERLTPNRYMLFMERSLPDVFTPKRHTGISAWNTFADERGTWAVGGFRSGNDNYGNDFSDQSGWSATGRVSWLPWYDEESDGAGLWHWGTAYSYRGVGSGTARFANRPKVTVNAGVSTATIPFFVDTGNVNSTHYQLFGVETALVYNCFSLQSEYMWVPLHRSDGAQPDLFFQGAYVYGSWYLTGEHRVYNRKTGTFDRTIPHTNAFKGNVEEDKPRGIGAWELAARWSYLDLNSQDVAGGRLNDITFGLNWYLNPYTRVTWNYIHSLLDSPVNGDSTANIYGMRLWFDF